MTNKSNIVDLTDPNGFGTQRAREIIEYGVKNVRLGKGQKTNLLMEILAKLADGEYK